MSTTDTKNDSSSPDEARVEAFAERFVAALNESSLMMMFSIGHRTGLFDTMDGMAWSTSPQIADAAGLNERYVREWLGAMVTGKVVDYQPTDQSYKLPAEHARWLTRKSTPENLAVTSQWISVMGCVESQIVDKFKTGGGVSYECYERFHETMAEESAQTVVAALHDHILRCRKGLADLLEQGAKVLDVGCGSGRAACALAKAFPASSFTGYDLCEDAIIGGQRAGPGAGPIQRGLPRQGHHRARRTRGLRPGHGLRHRARPEGPRVRARQHLLGAETRRHVPHAGHRRLEPPRKEHRPSRSAPSGTPSRPCTA